MRRWLWIAPMLFTAAYAQNYAATTAGVQSGSGTQVAVAEAATSSPASGRFAATDEAAPPLEAVAASPVSPPAAIVIPRGTSLNVRVNEALSTKNNVAGDRFTATLIDPVVVGGRAVLPAGTQLTGHILQSKPSGRLEGRAQLALALDSFVYNGQRHNIETAAVSQVSKSHKGRNWVAIGGGSGLGAAVGAIASGGTGALIGAGAGAAAGTVGAAATGKKEVSIPAESVMRFTLGAPVRL